MSNLLALWAMAGKRANEIMSNDPTIPRAVAANMAIHQIKKEMEECRSSM